MDYQKALIELQRRIAETMEKNTITPSVLKSFISQIAEYIKKTKDNFENISAENQKRLESALIYLEAEHSKLSTDLENKVKSTKEETTKLTNDLKEEVRNSKVKAQKELNDALEGLKALVDTITFDEEFAEIDSKIKKTDSKVEKLDKKLEDALKNSEEYLTETKVKGKYISQKDLDRALSILDQRTSFLLQKNTGVSTFLGLSDTPSSYSGGDDRIVTVSGNSLVFGRKITVSATEPADPAEGDIWIDIS